jgi:hypothetical protein
MVKYFNFDTSAEVFIQLLSWNLQCYTLMPFLVSKFYLTMTMVMHVHGSIIIFLLSYSQHFIFWNLTWFGVKIYKHRFDVIWRWARLIINWNKYVFTWHDGPRVCAWYSRSWTLLFWVSVCNGGYTLHMSCSSILLNQLLANCKVWKMKKTTTTKK